ncbi:unnamed protein product [Polarella glacialis]|uniref:Nucleotide-diphospho-sugar transferase domain-containing protein n=1 Tax=Polarella glacialis TaxID=89957 RepID=A0A813EHV4_POLGL|nr:unnamed protein product [Polarella glacialis]
MCSGWISALCTLVLLHELAGEHDCDPSSSGSMSRAACSSIADAGKLTVPFTLLEALSEVRLEEGEPPTSAAALRESLVLVRPGAGLADTLVGARRKEVPRRMMLPLPKEYFVQMAGPEKLVILGWTTGAPAEGEKLSRTVLAVNLALSIRKHAPQLESRFAYISMDTFAHEVMEEYGFNSVLCEAGPCRSTDLKDDIWKMRWYLMLTMTSFGLSVLVVDADIVFLGDPTKEFARDSDMEVMTDHFFPERHLWEPWVRVEDHINTGFVLVRPAEPVRFLIADFLEENWLSEQGSVRRDGMDQRVFNHFIVRRMSADVPQVIGRYGDATWGRPQQIVPTWPMRQVSIRILNPARIAHGMNFFWRRAHLLDPEIGHLPAVAHVNGADPKEYFLRDRDVWFVDDWQERFGSSPKFLIYTHPPGQTLEGDFARLSAALEAAKMLKRQLVLPNTMNCQNTPAYRVWNLDITVQRETERGNCTFDYFSWAKNVLDTYAGFVVESGLVQHPEFQQLLEDSVAPLPRLSAWPKSLSSFGGGYDRWLDELLPAAPAVAVIQQDILEVREALRQRLHMEEWDSHTCIFQQFPHQVNVCRDDRYVGRFGKGAQCDPAPDQAACGFHGFTCCMSFWGYSEKLEIFTGARWDLPCNCGLGSSCVLTKSHEMDREEQQYIRKCCANAEQPSPQEHCMLVPPQRSMTIYGDSHFYSSYMLNNFLDGRIDPLRAMERCSEHRAGTLLDTDPSRALLHCGSMIAGLALFRGRYDRAFKWLEHLHWLRRRPGAPCPLSMETGQLAHNVTQVGIGSDWKLRHDVEQLKYISKLPRRQQVSPYAPLASPEFATSLAEALSQLLDELRPFPRSRCRAVWCCDTGYSILHYPEITILNKPSSVVMWMGMCQNIDISVVLLFVVFEIAGYNFVPASLLSSPPGKLIHCIH